MTKQLPYQTAELPGTGGFIKSQFEDFQVEELPAYDAAGSGTHTFFQVEKRGLTTLHAVRDLARALGVAPHEIGYAGLKDARALTRQWFSVEHIPAERVQVLNLPKLRVLSVRQHFNKLKIGHLAGNRFALKVRGLHPEGLQRAEAILTALKEKGVPNYFGPQRFGARGDSGHIGRAMLRGQIPEALGLYLGQPGPADQGFFVPARQAYEAGQYQRALELWPFTYREERRALRALAEGAPPRRAWALLDRSLKRLFLSAYQSWLFNETLAERIRVGQLGRVLQGDLAAKHDTGAVFAVENADAEQPRADRLEISPTGPLFGYRMSRPTGQPGEWESALLAREGLRPEDFRQIEHHKLKGVRRAMRFVLHGTQTAMGTDRDGPYLELRFTLKKGCYATSVLRELLKSEWAETGELDRDSEEAGPSEAGSASAVEPAAEPDSEVAAQAE